MEVSGERFERRYRFSGYFSPMLNTACTQPIHVDELGCFGSSIENIDRPTYGLAAPHAVKFGDFWIVE